MIPFVPGSGFNGVGNWLHDNIVESFQWLHDEMEKCVMCGPSLSTVVGMVLDASMPTLYRGGNRFVPKPGEFRLNPDGTVKTGYGLSVNTDSDAMVEQFGSATQIKGLPTGLTAIQRGKNLAHWEIVPAEEGYTMEEVLELLDKIDRVPIE